MTRERTIKMSPIKPIRWYTVGTPLRDWPPEQYTRITFKNYRGQYIIKYWIDTRNTYVSQTLDTLTWAFFGSHEEAKHWIDLYEDTKLLLHASTTEHKIDIDI